MTFVTVDIISNLHGTTLYKNLVNPPLTILNNSHRLTLILAMDTLNPATLLSGRWRQQDIPSLTGKTAIVTGGDNGIGELSPFIKHSYC
jgi:hypothetical protein